MKTCRKDPNHKYEGKQCKVCQKIANIRNRENNKEKIVEYMKNWNVKNRQRISEVSKIYREKNKEAIFIQRALYKANNKDKVKASKKKWADKNKSRVSKVQKIYRELNKESIKERLRIWGKNNPHKVNALSAKRSAIRKERTPKWLNNEYLVEIEKYYKKAKDMSISTGISYHVDHIIPLQGKTVCGLHVPWNLQIITATENLKKGNKLLEI